MQSHNLSQSQSQSLLGNVEPGPSTNPDAFASTQGGVNAPPQFINPMMLSGSVVNPGILGLSQPMPGLSDQDVIRIASLIKQMLQQEIDQIVTIKVDAATATLRSQLNDVQNRCKFLEEEVKELKVKNDDIEQYSRRMCLRISGLKEFDHEDVTAKVLDFAKKVDVNISDDDIDRAHRVGRRNTESSDADDWNEQSIGATSSKSREIIVKFTNSSARLKLLKGRTKLRLGKVNNVFINEHLTPTRKELAFECRKLKRNKKSKITKTWVYAGYPHILENGGYKLKITCISDLDAYQVDVPKPTQPTHM